MTHEAFVLVKDSRMLRCTLEKHPVGGLELRLWMGDELIRSQVYRHQDAMLAAVDAWRGEAEGKGWRDVTDTPGNLRSV